MSAWKTVWDRIPVFVNYALILAAIGTITLFFPDNLRFKYQYEAGKTWPYEDLHAPFNFAVPKEQKAYQRELEEVASGFKPLYRHEDSIVSIQLKALEIQFEEQFKALEPGQFPDVQKNSSTYLEYSRRFLEELFTRGIVEWDQAGAEIPAGIQVVHGNTTRSLQANELLSIEEAREMVADSLPFSRLADAAFLFPILTELIRPNVRYDANLNEQFLRTLEESVSPFQGMVQKGELIVLRGGIITDEIFYELEGFRLQYEKSFKEKRSGFWLFTGYFLLTLLVIGVLIVNLWYTHPFIIRQLNHLVMILLWPVLFGYLVFMICSEHVLSPYILPFAIVPIVIKNFYDARLALYVHLVVVLVASILSSLGFTFIFLQLIIGVVIVITRLDTHSWSRFFYAVGLIVVVYGIAYFALALTETGALNSIDWSVFPWLLINGFLVLLAYPLTSLLERLLGLTSILRLTELADTNRPLLQLLAQRAPGSFQHSLQVANLAEAAARQIGADQLLVKVGALYHDIGKTAHPEYFIENQSGQNPHDGLPFEESARRIIEHVTEGVALARKYGLPRVVADFMLTHHGTTRVEYFFQSFFQKDPESAATREKEFRYPGPKPVSKEATILMMADSIEAACKSLKHPSGQEIDEMIDRLIRRKAEGGQFEASALTFGEMETCKQVFKQMLRSVHHIRIEYPEGQKT